MDVTITGPVLAPTLVGVPKAGRDILAMNPFVPLRVITMEIVLDLVCVLAKEGGLVSPVLFQFVPKNAKTVGTALLPTPAGAFNGTVYFETVVLAEVGPFSSL